MNRSEANELLDKQKDGIVRQSLIKVTEALWQTGDISRSLPVHARPFDNDGINEWMESSCVAQGEGTGGLPDSLMAWNNNRFDEPHESPI